MALEIERKFLLANNGWQPQVRKSYRIVQAYLSRSPERTVRVRVRDDEAFLTIKISAPISASAGDAPTSNEFEYNIPLQDAEELLKLCLSGTIHKTRNEVLHAGHLWEIDVFHGDNEGLIVAEIELADAAEQFTKPDWVGDEVTADKRYSNAHLSKAPYKDWD